MKVHLLQHMPDVVHKWGGLWEYSCYWYESLNGTLKTLYMERDMSLVRYDKTFIGAMLS